MDRISKDQRSALMGRIKGKNTRPEMVARRMAHSLGYRFRLHRRDLPGTPDLTFPRFRCVIFVHGCFWHQHAECRRSTMPKSRQDYWQPKLARNVERDQAAMDKLKQRGWRVLVIWECEVEKLDQLRERLSTFLSAGTPPPVKAEPSARFPPIT